VSIMTIKFIKIRLIITKNLKRFRSFIYFISKKHRIYYQDNNYLHIYKFKNSNKLLNRLKIYKKESLLNIDI